MTTKAIEIKRQQPLGQPPAYPHIWNFIPYPGVGGGEGSDGLLVAAGTFIDVPVQMDDKAAFLMLSLHLDAYNASTGSRYETITAGDVWPDYYPNQYHLGTTGKIWPLHRYLEVGLEVSGMHDRTLYGGAGRDSQGVRSRRLVPLPNMQGSQQGPNQLRVPHLVRPKGVITVTVKNTHASVNLRVNGCILGYKLP